ncbi:MAG: hypothetical protein RL605_780 [Actinomycetota bacterium]
MIAALTGTVLELTQNACVLDVSGVGYLVSITPALSISLASGQKTTLVTTLVVREDSMTLFGFASGEERNLFDLLRGVNGVGPKLALAVLAHLTPEQIADAVVSENDKVFSQVSGVGPKTAKLLVVTLGGRLKTIGTGSASASKSASTDVSAVRDAVVLALTGLGIQEAVATGAVDEVLVANPSASRDILLRDVLAAIGKAKR